MSTHNENHSLSLIFNRALRADSANVPYASLFLKPTKPALKKCESEESDNVFFLPREGDDERYNDVFLPDENQLKLRNSF